MKLIVRYTAAILLILGIHATAHARQSPAKAGPHDSEESLSSQGLLDTAVPLVRRLTAAPPQAVVQRFSDPAAPAPTFRSLSAAERNKFVEVLQQLPPFARQALLLHVRSISFTDAINGNGTTMKEPGSGDAVFNIVVRSSILQEDVSAFLTRKERGCFMPSDDGLTPSVEAGHLPALLYILLHESIHVLDISNRDGRAGVPMLAPHLASSSLVEGVWTDERTPADAYRSSSLEAVCFRTDKPQGMASAGADYEALARTPFLSLYGSSNWYEDAAELVTCFYLTQVLHQPYRIVLRRGEEIMSSLSPASSPLVKTRFARIASLFVLNPDKQAAETGRAGDEDDGYTIFEQPGTMVRLPTGNRLSLYCQGSSVAHGTVVLEAGFGGGSYHAWHRLQPRIALFTRVCSYDRAGYGFSELGSDLPRNVKHDVMDLHALLVAAKAPGPYVLVGHSDGGHIISAFSDLYPKETAALVFLDAAVLLDKPTPEQSKPMSPQLTKYFQANLDSVKRCLSRVEAAERKLRPAPGDDCLSTEFLAGLPVKMADAVTSSESRPEFWKAYLSESEQHYIVHDDHWEADLLPHRWKHLPIQVFTASVASLNDAQSAPLYGLPADDHKAIAEARKGRIHWEALQAHICDLSDRCQMQKVPTAEHEVQNAVPEDVASAIHALTMTLDDDQ